jgi:hypothetical protein
LVASREQRVPDFGFQRPDVAATALAVRCAVDGTCSSDRLAIEAVRHETSDDQAAEAAERAAHAALSEDIFGPVPIRPMTLNPAWRTPTVGALAQAAYENRLLPSGHLDLDRLAILADACEEAGCTDSEFLGHLRSPEGHVRGCWPLDLLLNKK